MPYLTPAKKATKYSRYNPSRASPPMQDLGGWTFPSLTGRPHMGPFNKVMTTKSPWKGDEKYRQHDLGYSKITNSYLNYNPADQQLLDAPYEGAADVVGKGVFYGKKALDVYNTPSIYQGGYYAPKKAVDSVGTYNADLVPFRQKMPYTAPDRYVPPPKKLDRGYSKPSAIGSSSGARGSGKSGRKHDYIELYDFSS